MIQIGDYIIAKVGGERIDGFVEIVYEKSVDIIWYGKLYNIKKSEVLYVKSQTGE